MSVITPTRPGLGGFDGSGRDDFWRRAEAEMRGVEGFVLRDTSQQALAGGAIRGAGLSAETSPRPPAAARDLGKIVIPGPATDR